MPPIAMGLLGGGPAGAPVPRDITSTWGLAWKGYPRPFGAAWAELSAKDVHVAQKFLF